MKPPLRTIFSTMGGKDYQENIWKSRNAIDEKQIGIMHQRQQWISDCSAGSHDGN